MNIITPDKYFWLKDGKSLKSLEDLAIIIPQLSDEELSGYIKRGDFAKWVGFVFKEDILAHELRRARMKIEVEKVLDEYFNEIMKKREGEKKIRGEKFFEEKQKREINRRLELEKEEDEIRAKSFAEQVTYYTKRYKEFKETISELRKEGKDPYMAEVKLFNFPAKLHLAEVTRSQNDLDIAGNILLDVEKEIHEARNEEIINIKNEVELGAKKLLEDEDKQRANININNDNMIKIAQNP